MNELNGYFDYAAATPALPSVVRAMQPYFIDKFYNSSALYLSAQVNRQAIEGARHQIAQLIGAKQSEIIFTAGGTEANNLAIKGLMSKYPDFQVATSSIEHESVLEPAKLYNRTICKVDSKGFIDKDNLKKVITDKTILVSVMYANNEIGTIEPLKEVRQILDNAIKERKQAKNTLPLYLHSDACQAANYLDLQVNRLGVDLMTINAGKIYGPKQCGALYVKSGIELLPLISGGGQEFNIRSGTENLPAIAGFAAAAAEIRQNYHQEALRLSEIRDKFIDYITSGCNLISINGPVGKKRLANNINLTVIGKENETLLMQLDELGFKIATSSACSASDQEPSHVLRAIGLSDKSAQSSLRITLGRYSNLKNTMQLAETLLKIVDKN